MINYSTDACDPPSKYPDYLLFNIMKKYTLPLDYFCGFSTELCFTLIFLISLSVRSTKRENNLKYILLPLYFIIFNNDSPSPVRWLKSELDAGVNILVLGMALCDL